MQCRLCRVCIADNAYIADTADNAYIACIVDIADNADTADSLDKNLPTMKPFFAHQGSFAILAMFSIMASLREACPYHYR